MGTLRDEYVDAVTEHGYRSNVAKHTFELLLNKLEDATTDERDVLMHRMAQLDVNLAETVWDVLAANVEANEKFQVWFDAMQGVRDV